MNRRDKVHAAAVCLLILLAMGFSGWYENYVPTPQPTIPQMVRVCDREVDLYMQQNRAGH